MKPKEFEKYLACFGSDLNRWPQEIRPQAQTALQGSAQLQSLWAEAKALDELLPLDTSLPPSENFEESIITLARNTPQDSNRFQPKLVFSQWIQKIWQPLPALALTGCLVLGIVTGFLARTPMEVSSGASVDNGTEWANLLYDEEVLLWDENSN